MICGQEDPLEKEIAMHSSILAQETPWTEEPGGLKSMRLQRVRHDLATQQHVSENLCHLGSNDSQTHMSYRKCSAELQSLTFSCLLDNAT